MSERAIRRRRRTTGAAARAVRFVAPPLAGAAFVALYLGAAGPARAADTNVAAGATLSLSADVVLVNGDNFVAGDDSGARCVIHGNGFSLTAPAVMDAAGWTGTFSIHNCDVDGLGAPMGSAINLTAGGMGSISIVGSTFSTSNRLNLDIADHVAVTFNHNTIQADTITPEVIALDDSQPVFWSTGASDGTKVFQGNRIFKGRVKFTSSSNWLIGGSMPGDGNIMFGVRAGLELENDTMMTVRGNYSRTDVAGAMWNQVKNLTVDLAGNGDIIEHNVFVGRNWLVEMDAAGELRYNLLVDDIERGWVLAWADNGAKIHHNVMVSTRENQNSPQGAIVVVVEDVTKPHITQIYNNTIDLGGACTPSTLGGVTLMGGTVLGSLRSNAFVGIRVGPWSTPAGVVRAYDKGDPYHLDYADYNLFYTPDSPVKTNYGVTVMGKTERIDAGFALNDVPKAGALDAQADPMFAGTGKIPRTFPFNEADLVSGATTPCQILAYYRQVYTPGPGSPLIDSGDPADGAGNDIGAIGAGAPDDADQFGKLCDPSDIGAPTATPDVYTCKPVALALPGGGGGETPVQPPHGITCVCDASAGAPDGRGAVALAALALVVSATRRRRRRAERA